MNASRIELPPRKLISALRQHNLLPAIVFLPTRRRCDEAVQDIRNDRSQPANEEKRSKRQELFAEFSTGHPEIAGHKQAQAIINSGVASHHAGHVPAWKLLVEKMMAAGLLDTIFATSTVAAGVDFPARTVVISNADTRGNDGWRPLSASELQQMTGRAGRRGRDKVGFVVLVPGPFQNIRKIAELLSAKPDPLESKFRATYTSLLNLLDAYGSLAQVREVAEKSFAFRSATGKSAPQRQSDGLWLPFERRAKVLDKLGYINLASEAVTADGKWLADLRIDRPLIVGEALRAGIFDGLTPPDLAALIAAIASDPDRNYGMLRMSNRLAGCIDQLEEVMQTVAEIEWKFGVAPADELNASAATSAARWAQGIEWDELTAATRAEPGDLIRLLSRTGEALRQIAELREPDRSVASLAAAAATAILRDPVR